MEIKQKIIYADPDQTGAALRRELKKAGYSKTFFHSGRNLQPISNKKVARSDEAIRLTAAVESHGYVVVDVIRTKKYGILVRTKF